METRNKLRDLMTKVDRSDDLEAVLERVLQNTEELSQLSGELGIGPGAAGDKQEGEKK
jgi:type VI secretion system protein ImpB